MQEAIEGPITGTMTIGDLVQQYPSVVEILLDQGVHCVGCGAAYFETIEQGLSGHGKTPEEVKSILKQLNAAIPKEVGNKETLTITENASKKLRELLKNQKEGTGLRIKVMAGGCSGHQYEFMFDKENEKDEKIEVDGIKVLIDKESLEKMKGSKIDYIDSLTGAGFKVTNPNAASTCGCGQSFS